MNEIIEKIKTKHIKMKPRWHFALKSVFLIALSLISLFLLLFITSFMFRSGLLTPLRGFAWMLLLFSVLFIALLEYLIKRYAISYRRPVIYSLLIIISLIFVFGIICNKTCFHDRIEKRRLPGIERFYKEFKAPPMRKRILK